MRLKLNVNKRVFHLVSQIVSFQETIYFLPSLMSAHQIFYFHSQLNGFTKFVLVFCIIYFNLDCYRRRGQMSVWNSCLGDVRCYLEFPVSSVLQVCRDNGIDPLHDYTNHCLYTVYPTHRHGHPLVGTRARALLSLPARDNAGPEGHFKSVGLSTDTIVRVCPFYDPTDGEGGQFE